MPEKYLVNKTRRVNPSLAASEGVLHLKIAMATLEHHLEKNKTDLDIVREFENRARKFLNRCETARQAITTGTSSTI